MKISDFLSYDEFLSIIDELYDEIIVYDNNYKIVYVNKACKRHYGTSQEEMINYSFYDFADEYWSTSVLPYVYKNKEAVQQKQETKLGAKLLTIAIPIFDDDNNVKYVAMSVRDDVFESTTQSLNLLEDVMPLSTKSLDFDLIFGNSKMKTLFALVNEIIDLECPCLITGESGVGKTLIGKYIHEKSKRTENAFVHVNCAAISKDLFESELYGYEQGSFTGAKTKGKRGLALEANGGTLFLDEISEIPYSTQAKLLQFIQEKSFYPIGSTKPVKVDIRIITATNKDLKTMVEMGTFREDLYYRLNVFEIDIPPLRERKEDILLISNFYLNKYCQKYNKTHRFSEEVKQIFTNYSWKGNVRELSHILERLVVVTKEVIIRPWHLPKHLYEISTRSNMHSSDFRIDDGKTFQELMDSYEKEIIKKAYAEYGSSRKVAAKLGISQTKASRLYRKYFY
jgi:TyrR family helix-turn-helix protein/PAS domain S-box-containing protein